MAEFSRKEASGAVILLIYMSGKSQGLRDIRIFLPELRVLLGRRSRHNPRASLDFLKIPRLAYRNSRASNIHPTIVAWMHDQSACYPPAAQL